MKVAAVVFDCRCGGYDVVTAGGDFYHTDRLERAKREFHDRHDGDGCAYGYQPVNIDVPDEVLTITRKSAAPKGGTE